MSQGWTLQRRRGWQTVVRSSGKDYGVWGFKPTPSLFPTLCGMRHLAFLVAVDCDGHMQFTEPW